METMGILFSVEKGGATEISLTEYSIKAFDLLAKSRSNLDLRHNHVTKDIVLTGTINPETLHDRESEITEISSVKKLADWAILPEYCDCYKDIRVKIALASGVIVKESVFKDFYVVEYEERLHDKEEKTKKNDISKGYAYINDEKILFSRFELLESEVSVILPDELVSDLLSKEHSFNSEMSELSNHDKSIWFKFEILQKEILQKKGLQISFKYTEKSTNLRSLEIR